jgi:hypothetical protein
MHLMLMLINALTSNLNNIMWCTLRLLDGLNCKSKGENNGRRRSWGAFLGLQHFGGRGACWSSRMGLGRLTSNSITHTNLYKPNNKLDSAQLEHFGARMSHGQTQTHKTHHDLDLGEATTFPLIVYFVLGHGTNSQMSFRLETPKWESRNSQS